MVGVIMTKSKTSFAKKQMAKAFAAMQVNAKKNKKAANRMVAASQKRTGKQFGPVATINTAPVAIGNSVRGSKQQVVQTRNGVTVRGRDFAFNPIGSNTITNWTVVGGTPLTPAAFSDSTLRQYLQMYQKFKWISCVVHYITSSPTTSNGDVMFYYAKNRDNVFLNQTSTQLLPFVLSDEDTIIGPQWMNHSAQLTMKGNCWRSCDYGMNADVNDFSAGDIFLLSKTSSTSIESPGYVLIDYVVEFAELQISPRLLSLPLPRAQWWQTQLQLTATAVTSGNAVTTLGIGGNNISGTGATAPPGAASGDMYKIFLDITNSTPGSWTNITAATGFAMSEFGSNTAVPLVDGTTLYGMYNGSVLGLYPNPDAAYAGGNNQLVYKVTATVTYNIQIWMSLIGTISPTNLNPNF